jgi:hypothetical protein
VSALEWALSGIAGFIVWALSILLALGVGFRHGRSEGYETGRKDRERGIPRWQVASLPARRGPDGGDAA